MSSMVCICCRVHVCGFVSSDVCMCASMQLCTCLHACVCTCVCDLVCVLVRAGGRACVFVSGMYSNAGWRI